MSEKLKIVGFAWFTKSKKALHIGMLGDAGKIDDDLQFVIFVEDLDALREGRTGRRSVRIYKSRPFVRKETEG